MSLDNTANPETTRSSEGANATVPDETNATITAAFNEVMSLPDPDYDVTDKDGSDAVDAIAEESSSDADGEGTTNEADADPKETDEVTPEEKERGYLRESDYRQKTMKLAEERKTLESERSKFQQELETTKSHWISQVQAVEQVVLQHDPVIAEYNEAYKSGWAQFAEQNPGRAIALRAAVEERIGKLQTMKAQAAQHQLDELNKFAAAQHAILLEKVPEFRDVTKFKDVSEKIGAYLMTEGFEENEIEGLVDHRHFVIADKARRWDAHLAALKSAQAKKQEPVVRVQKPGAGSGKPSNGVSKPLLSKALKSARAADDLESVAELLTASL